jgi:hypothetical protein
MTYEGFDACISQSDASSHWRNVISWRWVLPVVFPADNKVSQLTNQRRAAPNVSRLRAASRSFELPSLTTLAPPESVPVLHVVRRYSHSNCSFHQLTVSLRLLVRAIGSCTDYLVVLGNPPRTVDPPHVPSNKLPGKRLPRLATPVHKKALAPSASASAPDVRSPSPAFSHLISSPLLPRRSSYSCTSSVGTPYRKIEDDTSLLEKDLLDLLDLRASPSAQPNIARNSKILVGGSTQRVLGDGNAVMSH